jgi:hypothetical protein
VNLESPIGAFLVFHVRQKAYRGQVRSRLGAVLKGNAAVADEYGDHRGKEVLIGEHLVGAFVWPGGFDAEKIAFLEPEGDLLDTGLFEVVGEAGRTHNVHDVSWRSGFFKYQLKQVLLKPK